MNGRNIKSVIAGIRYEGLKPKVYLRMLDPEILDPSEWTGTRPNKKESRILIKKKDIGTPSSSCSKKENEV